MHEFSDHGTTRTEIESMSRSRQSLDYIRQELLEYRPDLVDEDLRRWVTEFITSSADLPPGSAREHIARELHDIKEDNAMYRETGMTDAEDAFPDRCRGCTHYGNRCPVLTKTAAIDRRERIFRETTDPTELRRQLREYAIDNDCHVIKDAINDLVEDHEPMVAEGQLLLMRVEEELFFGETDEEAIRTISNQLQRLRAQRLEAVEAPGNGDGDGGDGDEEAGAEGVPAEEVA